ncbi:MAG: UDP-3-O-[3-hydroxymyristoyl] N-acetylglucosamine deacetylase, partial [Candidatus Aminicenantes bacterium]|nr:UDP-3-O-[3-hydroxymyristoyl] N-acetylglucosamine deacetylase [Candidatus Aminicenantes bacterium]
MRKTKATIAGEVQLSGIGVHSGQNVLLTLKPSKSGEIVFYLVRHENYELRPDPHQVESMYSSILGKGEKSVRTIEHLMAALFVLGIDSLNVYLDGEEIPICDGSALEFVKAILAGGIEPLNIERKLLKIILPFTVREEDAYISVEPCDDFRLVYTIDYDHPAIRKQSYELRVDEESFVKEIAPARTFGFLKDVEALRERGLALGGSLENALVLDENGLVNGPLRFEDEFV